MTIVNHHERMLWSGTEAERITVGTGFPTGATFFCTDTGITYTWTGSAWVASGSGGLGLWDDQMSFAVRLAGARDPSFSKVGDNGLGSRGVYAYIFDDQAVNEREVFFDVQVPHAWLEGSAVHPHIHWTPSVNGGAGEKVQWGLEYYVVDIGDVLGNTTIIYAKQHDPADASLVAKKHYLTEWAPIAMAGLTLSNCWRVRMFRNSSDAVNDTYTGDARMFSFDLHIQKDALGSRQETVK